ncbi:unnamed protein product, partial [Scytosiphon promiscuus]
AAAAAVAAGGAGAGAGGPPLVEWSPVYSNYFAYSSGNEGSGIDLYRVSRSISGEAELLGARGSITDRRPSGGAMDHHQQQQQHHQQQQQQQQQQQHQHLHQHQQPGAYRTATTAGFQDPARQEGLGGYTTGGGRGMRDSRSCRVRQGKASGQRKRGR